MTSEDWLLIFLSSGADGVSSRALDPVRIQKGMFLLSKRGPASARNAYDFEPYNWGPFSRQVYRDLDELENAGLIQRSPVEGQSWSVFTCTPEGALKAAAISESVSPEDRTWLLGLRSFVQQHSFAGLLKAIYEAYPEYATRSMLR